MSKSHLSNEKYPAELDSCAVGGFFTSGREGNLKLALEFLKKLPHRGAYILVKQGDEAIKVGDGAGVSCDIDWEFYNGVMTGLGIEKPSGKPCGIGNFFLPIDDDARKVASEAIADICKKHNVQMLPDNGNEVWREIPFNSSDSKAAKDLKLQKFQQCFLAPTGDVSESEFEAALLKIHQEVETYSHQLNEEYKQAKEPLPKLAVASVSSQKVIYKGMILPDEVKHFTDLQKSNPKNVVYHIRQSTNTSPSPGNAQPFYVIGHNGELNSVGGNADKSHRLPRGFSDSRTFDEHLRELISSGKGVVEAITTLMPPPNTGDKEIDEMLKDIRSQGLEYNGPAHMVFSVGGVSGAKMDSSALRPSRYLITRQKGGDKNSQQDLYIGSEDMFSDGQLEEMGLEVVERNMLKAGEMIILDKDGKVKKNQQILGELQEKYQKSCNTFEKIEAEESKLPNPLSLGKREDEIVKYQMLPFLGGAINKIAMGDDTSPLLSGIHRLADHFKQKFSQVSSPPLDSEKERESFSLTTYLGDKTASPERRHLYEIDSPVLKLGELEAIKSKAGDKVIEVDLAVDLSTLSDADRDDKEKVFTLFRGKIKEICENVEQQINAGKSIIILDGSKVSKDKMGLPDILVMGALHSHLHSKNLEKKASIIVNSAEAESAHHISVLSSLGAAAVNPIGFYDLAAEIAKKEPPKGGYFSLFSGSLPGFHRTVRASEESLKAKYQEYCEEAQHGLEKAHLVTMAKYGITSAMTYSGSRLVESLTLNLHEYDEKDPSCLGNAFRSVKYCDSFVGKAGVNDILTDAVIAHQRKYDSRTITSGHFAYSPHGVDHTYNPTVVRAIRNATTEYRARRDLAQDLGKKADVLEEKLGNIAVGSFDFNQYKANLKTEQTNFEQEIKGKNRQVVQLENQNDKFINSLFFIDGIAKELGAIITGDEAEKDRLLAKLEDKDDGKPVVKDMEDLAGNSSNKADGLLIRQFLSIFRKPGQKSLVNNFSDICDKYKNGKINFNEFKKTLFGKAGYDVNELEKIEQWGKLVKEEKATEAAAIFKGLNDQNRERIGGVYKEYEENKEKIQGLRQDLSSLSMNQTVNNVLLEAAGESNTKEDYTDKVKEKVAFLRSEAKKNNLLPDIVEGSFYRAQMDAHPTDKPFREAMKYIAENKQEFRVTIADHLEINYPKEIDASNQGELQLVSNIIANHFVTGGMSYGALTESAHNDVARAAQLIGGKACTGEGGKPEGQIAQIVQIASGRFGINPEYFSDAEVVEIKMVQGAKPGEGGMLPAGKVSKEIAAIRGAAVGIGLISPPPHHDIYSIEDLQELIKDIKELKPNVDVAVKLCASEGIDQIAIGVAKSGADIINIAGGSGGTGAAAVDSIKSTGLPSEVGLVMAHQALAKAGIRDLVKLQTSGFPNTPEGVIAMVIFGGDILESGTTDLMLLGCDMHRKCNVPGACAPGITNNEEGYQGHAEDLALYKLNMAKAAQELLEKLGVKHLKDLRGRVELLSAEHLRGKVSDEFIESLLAKSDYPQLPADRIEEYKKNANKGSNEVEYKALSDQGLLAKIDGGEPEVFDVVKVDVINRAFGAGLAFKHYEALETKAEDHITIKTKGVAGQSYGAFNTHGLCLEHTGSVQDGCGKSMSGGVLVVKQPESERGLAKSVYAGNAAFYGASGGKAFIPSAGNRCGILMHGATLVVNGNVGDFGCEYMTSGSFLALGKVGKDFGSVMSGGVAALYDQNKTLAGDAIYATGEEAKNYYDAIKELLKEDFKRTGDQKIQTILNNYEAEKSKFKIVLPKSLDKIDSLEKLEEIKQSFELRRNFQKQGEASISTFEKVWLASKEKELSGKQANQSQPEKTDDSVVEMLSKFSQAVATHITHMGQYAPIAAKIVGGLGVPDQTLSDDPKELMGELFNQGKKCRGCDASSCAGEKTPPPKQAVSGCPINKEPNSINSILKGEGNYSKLSEEDRAKEAFKKQIKQSPFAGFTGAACPAPCQDACTQSVGDEGNSD